MNDLKTTYLDLTKTVYWTRSQWLCWDGSVPPVDWELPPEPKLTAELGDNTSERQPTD